VVTKGVFNRPATGGDPAKSEVDRAILRSTLPKSEKIGFGFLKALGVSGIAQSPAQAELILGVLGITDQGGAQLFHGGFEVAGIDVGQSLCVELAPASLLVGIKAVDEMADRSKGGHGRREKENENGGSRTWNELR